MPADVADMVTDTAQLPLTGVEVTAINHSAWDSNRRVQGKGKTKPDGTVRFQNLDTGVFGGDFYAFRAELQRGEHVFFKDEMVNLTEATRTIHIVLDVKTIPDLVDQKLREMEERIYANTDHYINVLRNQVEQVEDEVKRLKEDIATHKRERELE